MEKKVQQKYKIMITIEKITDTLYRLNGIDIQVMGDKLIPQQKLTQRELKVLHTYHQTIKKLKIKRTVQ